jgi:putative transposase
MAGGRSPAGGRDRVPCGTPAVRAEVRAHVPHDLLYAKSIHDAGWSAFVGMLEYKARLYGREFCRIGRFTPTSQTCSACGVKDGPKPLRVRAWQRRSCQAWLDRDINAAVNVAKAAGLAVTAWRAQVRRDQGPRPWHSAAKQEPPVVTPQSGVIGGNPALQGGVEVKRACPTARGTTPARRKGRSRPGRGRTSSACPRWW